jgi:hypothetical protein
MSADWIGMPEEAMVAKWEDQSAGDVVYVEGKVTELAASS